MLIIHFNMDILTSEAQYYDSLVGYGSNSSHSF